MRFFIDGYRRLLTHPRYGVWVLLATLLYLVSPIDLSPDILPLLGQIDDVALIMLLVAAASQWVSQRFLQAPGGAADSAPVADPQDIRQTIDVDAIEVDRAES